MTLEHKTRHTGQFLEIEIYASSESWLNHISIDVWFEQYLKIWNLRVHKNLNIEKIVFKVVQIKLSAMHITNKKISFNVGHLLNIFMEHDLNILKIFGIKDNFGIFFLWLNASITFTNISDASIK